MAKFTFKNISGTVKPEAEVVKSISPAGITEPSATTGKAFVNAADKRFEDCCDFYNPIEVAVADRATAEVDVKIPLFDIYGNAPSFTLAPAEEKAIEATTDEEIAYYKDLVAAYEKSVFVLAVEGDLPAEETDEAADGE